MQVRPSARSHGEYSDRLQVCSSATLHVMHARMWGITVAAGGMSGESPTRKTQAPPGARRTAVRRQAGLRAYELPWGHGGTVTFPSLDGSVVVRSFKRPTVLRLDHR